jgi:hypothetical protein
MRLPLPGGALTRKSIADVTRRRLRTILVVLGIAVGVLGLTAINIASDALNSAADAYQGQARSLWSRAIAHFRTSLLETL